MRRIQLLDFGLPGRPAFDTAFSRALLDQVASGAAAETFRLYRPDDVLAFSGVDAAGPGFDDAIAIARDAGFTPAMRLAGGRAAVFHTETLAFAWTIPTAEVRDGIHARFVETSELIAAALRRLGVDARIGEVAGEYCPGEYSVNARGARKLMGVGQRVIRGAAHVGGVLVVEGSQRVRAVLEPVYAAMGVDWNPATTGSVADEVAGASCDMVANALLAELRSRFELVTTGNAEAVAAAEVAAAAIEPRFAVAATPARAPAAPSSA